MAHHDTLLFYTNVPSVLALSLLKRTVTLIVKEEQIIIMLSDFGTFAWLMAVAFISMLASISKQEMALSEGLWMAKSVTNGYLSNTPTMVS